MMIGMTTAKIAVSIPEDILRGARRAVKRGRAGSMSAYVTSALAEKAKLDDLEELLDEMLEASGGPLTDAEIAVADAALRGSPPRRTRREGRSR